MKKPVLTINEKRREVFVKGKRVHLGRKEFDVLRVIASYDGIASLAAINTEVYGDDPASPDSRTIAQHVSRIRRKLRVPVIETVNGFGYRLAP